VKSKPKKPRKTLRQKRLQNFLNNKDFWNIVGMVRGPDEFLAEAHELKYLTTGRVRYLAGVSNSTADKLGVVVSPYPLSPGLQNKRDELLSKASSHFQNHYWTAVKALFKLTRYNLGDETPVRWRR